MSSSKYQATETWFNFFNIQIIGLLNSNFDLYG